MNEIRDNFDSIRIILDKEHLDRVLGFESRKDKILGLFAIRYSKFKKLINEGALVFVYTYKINYITNNNNGIYYKAWNIYSPNEKYENNPEEYSKIAAKLNYFLENKDKKYKKIIKQLKQEENDFGLIQLPKECFDDENIYISTIYTRETTTPDIKVGINVALINRQICKNLYFLPFFFLNKQNDLEIMEKVSNS